MNTSKSVELAVVIVNYRTPSLVIDCLDSLLPEISEINAEIVVVDNASGDNSLEEIEYWLMGRVEKERSVVKLLQSEVNGGFSAGNNIGIRAVTSKYYLLLNSDTIVRPGAIEIMLHKMRQRPEIGALGPRLEFLDSTPQISAFRKRTALSELIRGAELSLVTRLLKNKKVPIEIDDINSGIEWVSFACVLIRSEVVDKIGLMDEGFFMYFEDIEYCNRMRAAGFKIEQEASARVVHLRGGTASVKSDLAQRNRLPRYFYESRARYFSILGGKPKLIAANIAWIFGRIIRTVKLIKGFGALTSIPSEWKDIWIGLNKSHKYETKSNSRWQSQA
ncbi:glycosyltransferase family 2 protein [Microbulbifer sp. SA54]|uniref:glycosyltransferase family 2 protein n=1 Tax=Microbulbifer sp. SA54 TaxID=3401577 RepID=UPI003AAF793E